MYTKLPQKYSHNNNNQDLSQNLSFNEFILILSFNFWEKIIYSKDN